MTVNMITICGKCLHSDNSGIASSILESIGTAVYGSSIAFVYRPNQIVLNDFFDPLEFDCLNCAEYLMSVYANKPFKKDGINSRIVDTTSEIGKTNPGNAKAVNGYVETIDHDVDPEVGQAYFICRTYPKSVPSEGAAFYHAAFVIAKSDDCNFTLETFHGEGWNFVSYDRPGWGEDTFHKSWANHSCFEGKNVRTVAIELIQ